MMIATIRNTSRYGGNDGDQPFLHDGLLETPKIIAIQTELGVDWLTFLPHIWEVPDLNLGLEILSGLPVSLSSFNLTSLHQKYTDQQATPFH
jgi:hypothetical protein